MSNENVVHAFRMADSQTPTQHVFIRDLMLTALIGIYRHEKEKPQPIRINLDLSVKENLATSNDRLSEVVSYEEIADDVRKLVASGHVNLVETLAQRIADMCFRNRRVEAVRVRVEKLAVFKDAASAGVEIERYRTE
ncbi:MAG: dihydroneopterin aldolase [Pseudomonadota bacterium]|nr:dihydroneopterin aldolase [Pseudomonadota bacterium]